jgi:hypothetical protein
MQNLITREALAMAAEAHGKSAYGAYLARLLEPQN